MTENEAKKIIKLIKEGKYFASRFQDAEWGIEYIKNEGFRVWSREMYLRSDREGNIIDNSSSEVNIVEEEEAIKKVMAYNFERFKNSLRDKNQE